MRRFGVPRFRRRDIRSGQVSGVGIGARVWDDVRHGRQLDLYAAVGASIVVFLLSFVGVPSQQTVLTVVMAVLALLAIALLIQRDQNRQLQTAVSALSNDLTSPVGRLFVEEDLTGLVGLLRSSHTVWLWGATLQTHTPLFAEEIETGLRRGHNYRVLFIEQSGSAVAMSALRSGRPAAEFDSALDANIARLSGLRAPTSSGTLEIGQLDYLSPYVLYVFDPGSPSGRMFVRIGTFAGSTERRPTFWVSRQQDGIWFDRFVAEFEDAWKAARKV